MFQEVKDRLSSWIDGDGDEYDAQIIGEIYACEIDLTSSAEIKLPGTISITRTQDPQTSAWTITDSSTITDQFVISQIAIWCNMNIGNPPNRDALEKAYYSRKGQMRMSKKYTEYVPEEAEGE